MKILILLSLLLTTTLFAKINWENSYGKGLLQAKEEKKIALVLFSLQSCKVCRYMKRVVYKDEDIQKYIKENFVPIRINMKRDTNKYGYNVVATPTYYFIDSKGKKMNSRIVGGLNQADFLSALKEVVRKANTNKP